MGGASDGLQSGAARAASTFRGALLSAQAELKKIAIVFLIGFGASFYVLREIAWPFLKQVTKSQMSVGLGRQVSFIAQTPFDVVLLQVKIGLLFGALLTIPAVLYVSRDWLAGRGYRPVEQVGWFRLAILGSASVSLFVAGLSYGYVVFFPFIFKFLASNAVAASFEPSYSIVLWTQFIFFLSVSFGFAAQLPLVIPSLSYYGVVPYETFQRNWRKIVTSFFLAGAVLSPPDPVTQFLWAVPLVGLFGVSMYVARIAVLVRRSRSGISVSGAFTKQWNYVLGGGVLFGAAAYVFYEYGGRTAANKLLAALGSRYRFVGLNSQLPLPPEQVLLLYVSVCGILGIVLGLMIAVYQDTAAEVEPTPLHERSAQEIRRTPLAEFAALSEDEAAEYAAAAAEGDNSERARVIIQQHNKAIDELADTTDASSSNENGAIMQRLVSMAEDNEGVGGWLADIAFVLNSVRSKGVQIGAMFLTGVALTFFWLYQGGIGALFKVFLSRLPASVTADQVNVIALHPVEALVFEAKLSAVVGVVFTLPVLLWYAWPALRELNLVTKSRNILFGATGTLLVGFLAGLAVGYLFVAPTIISYLAADAINAGIEIKYRISDFFWLIVALTAGIGVLVDIPIAMTLLYKAGFPFEYMYERWRVFVFTIFLIGVFTTPGGIATALLLSAPIVVAYLVGLGIVYSLDRLSNVV